MNKEPLRVAIFSNFLPPAYSGAGQQAVRIATWLKRTGHNVFFVTPRHPDHEYDSTINGIPVYDVKIKKVSGNRGNIMAGIKALGVLIKKRDEYDILFCPYMGTLIGFLFLALKVLRKKIIIRMSLFLDDPALFKKRKLALYYLLPYHLADKIIAPSTARLKGVLRTYPQKVSRLTRINNCVDTQKFLPCKSDKEKKELFKSLQLEPEKKYVSFVGRIIERKGVEFLIDAWSRVAKQYDDAILLLIGPVDYKSKGENGSEFPFFSKIKNKINDYGLNEKIKFIGETDIVQNYLKISDVFVFASVAEGLPSAPIEAMATGVPPVVLNIEDIMSDIIDSGKDGIIINDKNIENFSNSILRFLKDEEYKIESGKKARLKVVENFSIESVGQEYISLFYDALNHNH